MKKIILLTAVASVTLASCTKTEKVDLPAAEAPISFSAIVNPSTKAIAGTQPVNYSLKDGNNYESFKVYGLWTENQYTSKYEVITSKKEDFMTGVKCSYNETLNAWKPENTYYWPKNGYLTFQAISPSEVSATHSWSAGFTITNFVVDNDITKQFDLLISDRTRNVTRADYEYPADSNAYDDKTDDNGIYKYNGVNLLFRHLLSNIVINAKTKAEYKDVEIKITGITIANVLDKGTFNEGVSDDSENNFTKVPVWTNPSYNSDAKDIAVKKNLTIETTANTYSEYILLPQSLSRTADDVAITIKYTISQHKGPAIPQTFTKKLSELTVSNTEDKITQWEINKRYIYTIVFGLDEIYFDPAVEDWTTVNAQEIEI